MKLKKYSKYKDSWIDWIWEIPENWSVRRLKFINKLQWWYAFKSEEFSEEWNDIIRIWDIKDNVDFDNAKKYPESIKIHKDFKIKNNDVLIALTWATIWKVWKVNNYSWKAYINQRVAKISWANNYYYYLLKSDFIKKQIELIWNGSAQENISNWQIEDFFIPFNDKQDIISSFLDSKTIQIENLIEKDKKLIELLVERRISLINKVVTKGLDYNVKMKDSWVEWIWEIPEGWDVNKMKHLLKINITDWPHETPEFLDDWIPFISAEAIKNSKIDFNYKRWYISLEEHKRYSLKCKPQLNDIFMIKSWATTWNIAMVETEEEFNIWSPLALMRVNEKIEAKLLFYNLMSFYFKEQVKLGWSFWTQENIWMWVIQNLDIITPKNIQEQQKIVEFLDKETEKIDNHIKKVEKRIELYEEYKKSLIYNVVTGKIEV
jgi:type I restriction enzyme S subunit